MRVKHSPKQQACMDVLSDIGLCACLRRGCLLSRTSWCADGHSHWSLRQVSPSVGVCFTNMHVHSHFGRRLLSSVSAPCQCHLTLRVISPYLPCGAAASSSSPGDQLYSTSKSQASFQLARLGQSRMRLLQLHGSVYELWSCPCVW